MKKILIQYILLVSLVYSQYNLSPQEQEKFQTKQIQDLQYSGSQSYIIKNSSEIIKDLQLQVRYESATTLDIKIIDRAEEQYQIPTDQEPFNSTYLDIENPKTIDESLYLYTVQTTNDPFILTIRRKETDEILFQLTDLEFSELYIAFKNVHVPSPYFFGMGERNQKGFRFREGIYTLMARDEPKVMEDGQPPGKHVYSSQPVYLMRENSGFNHVFFYKTASPMDFEYKNNSMKFITIGGVVHLKFFLGGKKANTAVKQYHNYLGGGYALHPFWSSGFHQSRWGYRNINTLIDVIKNYQQNDIPLDTIWSDLDYMFDKQIFSVNYDTYPLSGYQTIRDMGIKYVPLVDVAVGVKYPNDEAFNLGIAMDIFLRSPKTGQRFQGFVWPGDAYFPDFFHPNISSYWTQMVDVLHKKVQFDGLWIDMNEPANFCDGECEWTTPNKDSQNIPQPEFLHPQIDFPYLPGGIPLETKTLDPHLLDYNMNLHKDIHNLYGFMESWHSQVGQKALGKVHPFSLSRSTFPGSGRYTQHWFGDNSATWDMMYLSLGQIFQFNIFGIPLSGADVCGFMDNTEEKLCSRWIQLATIYPFFRNHNNDMSRSQEFYVLGEMVLQSAQKNIKLRYSLLKWYYSLFIREEMQGSIIKPLFFEFDDDSMVLRDMVMDTQLLMGTELMAAPILEKDTIIRNVYFPEGTWFEFITGLAIQHIGDPPRDHLIFCPYNDYIPIYIRGSSIILVNPTKNVMTTNDLKNDYTVIAALDTETTGLLGGDANGVFLDLDEFLNEKQVQEQCVEQNCLLDLSLAFLDDEFVFKVIRKADGLKPRYQILIRQIIIYGFSYTEDKMQCFDDSEKNIECDLVPRTYKYNSKIQFTKPVAIGGESNNMLIKIKFQS